MLHTLLLLGALGASPAGVAIDRAAPTELAATPQFRRFGLGDGLPSSVVYKLAQDRDGFIWIGTDDGLARYDGLGIRVYRNDPSDPASIAGNEVSALHVDRSNRVWTGGEGAGLNLLDTDRRGFRRYRHDPANPASLAADDVWAIAQDRAGAIWVGTYSGGLNQLDEVRQGFVRYSHSEKDHDSIGSDIVLSLLADDDGGLWIGADNGLDRRLPDGRFAHVDLSKFAAANQRVHVLGLLHDGESVLAATSAGLLRIDRSLVAQRVAAASPTRALYGLERDSEGDLWLASRRGAVRIVGDREQLVGAQPWLPGGLPGEALFDVLADHEGGLWFAALDGGVAYLAPDWRRFSQFREIPGDAASLARRPSVVALDASGDAWVANVSGALDRLTPGTGAIEHHAEKLSGVDPRIRSLLVDAAGRVWIGQARGLAIYDRARGSVTPLIVDAARTDALAAVPIDLLLEVGGAVWASAHGVGLARIDASSQRIERFDAGAPNGPRDGDIEQIAIAPDASLWVAHAQGIDRRDSRGDLFVALDGAPNERVHAFVFDRDGSVWLHRFGAIERYRESGGKWQLDRRIDADDGWPALKAGGLVLDTAGTLWLTTPRGLYSVDPASRRVRHFDADAGLASPEFVDHSLRTRRDGVLVAAALGGVVAFDPKRIVDEASAPLRLALTSLSAQRDGRRIDFDPRAPLQLDWNDRALRVEARALSFGGRNRFAFLLEGVDTDWSGPGVQGEREIAQIAAGTYRLRIRASVNGGPPHELVPPLSITVASPPWLRSQAYGAYALVGAALAWAIVAAWRRRLARRHEFALTEQRRRMAEQASAAKSDFLAHMGHEIRTPMTGLLGMSELLARTPLDSRQRGYADAIRQSGEHMLRLVNDALDLARIEARKLALEHEPFDPVRLLDEVGHIGIALADRKDIAFHVSPVESPLPRLLGDARRVRQILLNLVNNAVKFTSRGGVTLALGRTVDGVICYSVRDTGPGIAPELRQRLFRRYEQGEGGRRAGGSGLGLAICRELAELMGGRIELDSVLGQGSVFRVLLPLATSTAEAVPERRMATRLGWPAARERRAKPDAAVASDVSTPGDVSATRDILLVEDDLAVAHVVLELLGTLGHRVRHVADGLAAMAELTTAPVDLALLDLDLPGVDGLQLAQLIRAREVQQGQPRLRLIAFTARSEPEVEARAIAAGMDGFLRKPVTIAALAAAAATDAES